MGNFRKEVVILGCVLFFLSILSAGARPQDFMGGQEFRIGARDLLEVTVSGVSEITKLEVRVSEDGNITLPFIGEIFVGGLTKTQVVQKVAELLEREIVREAQVTILIKEFQSKRISILGAVKNPGTYPLIGVQTVLSIISLAGGLTGDAGKEIIIMRQKPDGSPTSLRIPLEELTLKGNHEFNMPLEPGDIVNIPMDKLVQVYVGGAVNRPGVLVVKSSNIPSVLQAIMMAGGFSPRASKKNVILKRRDEKGEEQQIKINVKDIIKGKTKDIQLIAGDILIISETIF